MQQNTAETLSESESFKHEQKAGQIGKTTKIWIEWELNIGEIK